MGTIPKSLANSWLGSESYSNECGCRPSISGLISTASIGPRHSERSAQIVAPEPSIRYPRILMQFELTHKFRAPAAVVMKAMLDERFPDYLLKHHSKMLEAEVLERHEKGGIIGRRVRYRPKPIIEKVGPKKIPPEYLAFVEESSFDLSAREFDFKNVPTVAGVAKHLQNGGTMTFVDTDEGCVRKAKGLLEITNLPFLLRPVGALAERIIFSEAQKLLDAEAKILQSFIDDYGLS